MFQMCITGVTLQLKNPIATVIIYATLYPAYEKQPYIKVEKHILL